MIAVVQRETNSALCDFLENDPPFPTRLSRGSWNETQNRQHRLPRTRTGSVHAAERRQDVKATE